MQEPGRDVTGGEARRLVLMRHAQAASTAPSDRARALTARGRADAEEAGLWLGGRGVRPDAALVSDALRAVQTWERAAAGAGWDCAVEHSAGLYAAGADSALDLVRETAADVRCLVVVGHNPTIATLAELLDDGDGEPDATTALLTRGFPAAAVAVFAIDVAWSGLAPGTGRLDAFHVGDG